MNKSIWFLHFNETVKGPYTTESIQKLIKAGSIPSNTLIWWKGQTVWLSIQEWQVQLSAILKMFKTEAQSSYWYVEHEGTQSGPFDFNQLKHILKDPKLKNNCSLWTTGHTSWKRVFELPDIIEELEIEKRKNFRAPIKGELSLQKNGKVFETTPGSISSGGLGFKDLQGINVGDVVSVTLKSPMLVIPIHSKAKVLYTQNNGVTGLQFLNLQAETQSTILDYIKQFQTTQPIL